MQQKNLNFSWMLARGLRGEQEKVREGGFLFQGTVSQD
jgi:hypothetical protein